MKRMFIALFLVMLIGNTFGITKSFYVQYLGNSLSSSDNLLNSYVSDPIDIEAPSIPTGLVATNITETSFDLSWDASTDNVGVHGYEVFQNGAWIGANTSPTLHVTGLIEGTTYSFTVVSFDTYSPANISGQSAALSVTTAGVIVPPTPDTEAPSIPAGLVATNITETSFELSWDASTDNVGIAFYELYKDGVWAGGVTETSKVFTGLNSNTAYSMSLRAYDAASNGSEESSVLIITTLGLPDTEAPTAPTGLVATNITETSFDLSWNVSTDNVGVFGYQVYKNGVQIGANTEPTLSITDLTAGTSYNFTVDAFDTSSPANISLPSVALSVTTAGDIVTPDTEAPSIPTGLIATNITETSFELSWDASTDNVGIAFYELYKDGVWAGGVTETSKVFTGLNNNTAYSMSLRAYDAASNGSEESSVLIITTLGLPDTEAPTAPTGLVATNITETSFDLSWNVSTDNVGVFGYQVYKNGVQIGANTEPTLSITNLTAGTSYNFTVDAFDTSSPANISLPSVALSVTTAGDIATPDTEAPSIPTGLVATNITETSFDLSWNVSTDNVGVFGYQVYKNGVQIGAITEPTLSITNLTAGTSYNFTVDAFDTSSPANISLPSDALSVTTAGDIATPDTEAPSIPTGLVATNITETSFDLSWDASTDNIGVHGYEVFKNGAWIGANTVPSLSITGLTKGTTYSFTVDAFDTSSPSNISLPSAALSVTTAGDIATPDTEAPSIPTGLVATNITKTSFDLSWTASTDNVAVHGYEVFRNGAWVGANTIPTLSITGLTEGTTYSFTVNAFDNSNPANLSKTSAPLSVTTAGEIAAPDTEAPSIPQGLVATNITETSFDLSWEASTDNVAVFGYEVYTTAFAWIGATTNTSLSITGLTKGTTYKFTVNSFDTANPANVSKASAVITVTTSGITGVSEVPTVPTGLVATKVAKASFTLSWAASTDNVGVQGYQVYQDGVYLGRTTDLSMEIAGLECGSIYAFTVDAFDSESPENTSNQSAVLLVSTVDCLVSAPIISSPEISIFPNPVASVFTVKNLPENAMVSVLTLDGRTMSKANAGANSSMEFDVTSWHSGVYIIQVQAGSSSIVEKVIVE